MIFVLNVKTLKNELFVVTRFFILKNATEYELSNITTPINKIDNKKTCCIITRITEKSLGSKKNDESVIKKDFNRKQREQYHREKVEKLLNRFEAMEIEVVGYYVLLYV